MIRSATAVLYSKRKTPVLLVAIMFPLAAAAALYALPRGAEYKSELLAVYFILQVYQCITPIVFSWAFANTAGHTKKTTTTGMLYLGLTVGNIGGPFVYYSQEAPYYHSGLTANLVVMCVLAGCVVFQMFYLRMLNLRNIKRRRELGRTGAHVDLSLENSSNWAKLRAEQKEKNLGEGHVDEAEAYNANAFSDL
jgi:uncharacterized membrane protein YciS (DUF1049 family)